MTANNKRQELLKLISDRQDRLNKAQSEASRLVVECNNKEAKWGNLVVDGLPEAKQAKAELDKARAELQEAKLKAEALQQALDTVRKDDKVKALAEEAVRAAKAETSELNEKRDMKIVQLEELQVQVVKIGLELMKIQEEQNNIYSETLEAYRTVHGRKAQLSFGTRGWRLAKVPFHNTILQAWRNEHKRPTRPERQTELTTGSLVIGCR